MGFKEFRDQAIADKEARKHGRSSPQMVCPHCQTRGSVRTRRVKVKQGISGSKATGAS
jgi:hypothetical protein